MDQQECRARLSTHGVGTVTLNTADGLVIMPVNYMMADDMVAFRTTYDDSLAAESIRDADEQPLGRRLRPALNTVK